MYVTKKVRKQNAKVLQIRRKKNMKRTCNNTCNEEKQEGKQLRCKKEVCNKAKERK